MMRTVQSDSTFRLSGLLDLLVGMVLSSTIGSPYAALPIAQPCSAAPVPVTRLDKGGERR